MNDADGTVWQKLGIPCWPTVLILGNVLLFIVSAVIHVIVSQSSYFTVSWQSDIVSRGFFFIIIPGLYKHSFSITTDEITKAGVIHIFSYSLKADSHIAYRAHAVTLPCHAVNSHMPCCAPALFRQCRVLRGSPRGS